MSPPTPATIPVFKPLLENDELDAAREALEMGWLGMGGYVGDFEKAIHDLVDAGDRHVVAVSTGHAAIHLSLLLMGVGPGDEVITPSFNNIADFQAILAVGAQPVFCDIHNDTLCIDVDKAHALVSDQTKAVIAMDYGSALCDHSAVQAFADQHGLRVLHDAAHSFGSSWNGKKVGSFSDTTMFSFDPVKTITTIDGGALIVKTEEEATRLREMRLIGMGQPSEVMYQNARAWTYDVKSLGFRYHMANLHARIGLSQIAKIDCIAQTRRAACRRYHQAFAALPQIQVAPDSYDHAAPFIFYIRVPQADRQAMRDHLTQQGVDTGIHWQPGHWFSLFKDARRGDLSITQQIGQEILTLPLHSKMPDADVDRVIAAVSSFYA